MIKTDNINMCDKVFTCTFTCVTRFIKWFFNTFYAHHVKTLNMNSAAMIMTTTFLMFQAKARAQ